MRLLLLATMFLLVFPSASEGQRRMSPEMLQALGDPNEFFRHPDFHGNVPYDGRFTFVRIKYRGFAHFTNEGPGWAHDYPVGETHLMRIMREVTGLRPFIQRGNISGGNVLALDDPELFRYPVAYFSEPGGWRPTPAEIQAFRAWLLKGGFVIFDDFAGPGDWMTFTQNMQRVLPKARIVELDPRHPIFDSFFQIDVEALRNPSVAGFGPQRGRPAYYGIFQDNDPRKRLMAIINFNNDIGDYWQFSESGFFPVAVSNEAYKLGVNYIIYALTH
jgi:hypothetical protein